MPNLFVVTNASYSTFCLLVKKNKDIKDNFNNKMAFAAKSILFMWLHVQHHDIIMVQQSFSCLFSTNSTHPLFGVLTIFKWNACVVWHMVAHKLDVWYISTVVGLSVCDILLTCYANFSVIYPVL